MHGHYAANPRRRRRMKDRIPKQFREAYKKLKAEQRKAYFKAMPIEKKLRKLFGQIEKFESKVRDTEIHIGRTGKKPTKIIIGGVDLLKLVQRVDVNEKTLAALDGVYERLEKFLAKKLKQK